MNNQLSLLEETPANPSGVLAVPPVIEQALREGASLAISISGGKDGQAMLNALVPWFREHSFSGQLFAIHADLGKAEWKNTPEHVQRMCDALGVPLTVVQRPKGDLVDRIEERLAATAGTNAPFWPSPKNRYCTSHLKSGPIDTELRRPFWPSASNRYCTSDLKRGPIDTGLRVHNVIISAEGVRAEESPARAKKPVVEVRGGITAGSKDAAKNLRAMEPEVAYMARQDGQRLAFNWRPLLHWTEADVWKACGTTIEDLKRRRAIYKLGAKEKALENWPAHPAYVYGNQRLSCALCVLATANDLKNGAEHNPELYRHYLEMERRGNATFKHKWSLSELEVTGEAARVRDEFLAVNG